MDKVYHCYIDLIAREYRELPAIIYLKNKGEICFYSIENDKFYTPDLNYFDVKDKIIIPHNDGKTLNNFHQKIKEKGGIIPGGIDQYSKPINWLDYYIPKRKIRKIKGSELLNIEVLKEIEKTYGNKLFLKTIEKNYNGIIKIEDLKDPKTIISIALKKHQDEMFIISEEVDVITDVLGNKEYRVFVYDNKILSISRFTKYFLHKIDPLIYDRVKEIVEQIKGIDFPSCYVLDLFEYKDKEGNIEIDVVEFNGYSAAGMSLYNSVELVPSEDMLHENQYNIAIEKRDLSQFCLIPNEKYNIKSESAIYYGEPGTFANELMNLKDFAHNITLNLSIRIENIEEYEEFLADQKIEKEANSFLSELRDLSKSVHERSEDEKRQILFSNLSLDECPKYPILLSGYDLPIIEEDIERKKFVKLKRPIN